MNVGMTDKQFNGFVRFVLDALKEAKSENEVEKKDEKLDKVIENLQKNFRGLKKPYLNSRAYKKYRVVLVAIRFPLKIISQNDKGKEDMDKEKKKMGRPLKFGEPRDTSLHLRISKQESERIKKCSENLNLNRTETIMRGIELLEKKFKL